MNRLTQLLIAVLLLTEAVGARADESVAAAAQPSLLDYELKRLDVPEVERLARFEGKPVLMMVLRAGVQLVLPSGADVECHG